MQKNKNLRLCDIGEKNLIKNYIKPLFNPKSIQGSIGDDCAVINNIQGRSISITTDRVPSNLISFKLGLIDYTQLGYYLIALNISDLLSNGAKPYGLVLTFAFESEFKLNNFLDIFSGIQKACNDFNCRIIGGDLSDCSEMSLSATAFGFHDDNKVLYRTKAEVGDFIFCSNFLGLTSTAFRYFIDAKPKGFILSKEEEQLLINQFAFPKLKFKLSEELSHSKYRITCMDNTDGVGQTLLELSELNHIGFIIDIDQVPIHDISRKVAQFLKLDILDVIFGFGADFQLIGTHESEDELNEIRNSEDSLVKIIGKVSDNEGLWLKNNKEIKRYNPKAWDYYRNS